jgi:hypothetical protein
MLFFSMFLFYTHPHYIPKFLGVWVEGGNMRKYILYNSIDKTPYLYLIRGDRVVRMYPLRRFIPRKVVFL